MPRTYLAAFATLRRKIKMQTQYCTITVHSNRPRVTRVERRKQQRARIRRTLGILAAYLMLFVVGGMIAYDAADRPAASADYDSATVVTSYQPAADLPDVDPVRDSNDLYIDYQIPEGITEEDYIQLTRVAMTVTDYDPDVDYSELIRQAYDIAKSLDDPADRGLVYIVCEVLEAQRNLKITDLEILGAIEPGSIARTNTFETTMTDEEIDAIMNPHHSYYEYTMDDAIRIAKIVHGEAGANWCTNDHRRDVASVIMYRVTSPKWPNTVQGVIEQGNGMQYSTWKNQVYNDRDLECAIYVLENGPTITAQYQSNFKQGHEVVRIYDYRDKGIDSVTYFCM